ncbi:MAG: TAXI family TRAP transporter solute-binding subunit [Bacillota bacterium]|uniref:TAXI family TRAP transporter solute-binding subunit n=1 Tax=Virgibacillus salarius TaxID=447199 RepID=A0A941DYX9_9BACI|nr:MULTISPECIES: TAXI family TRAP transporter solute-binding subunit [Virgibacillus]NAZ10939.1 TAXI family TRAP transporter solute-binding subunit [Agaribacter marinus]MBR7798231.1 TAXI family TRAP transporter solute-binding subunit [Virgibacillus salarius]MCC2252718.1 TAXI family TRAP transporter solute-binding subunit [Virgibacillus sp. AGTR]MDY7046708.1 TAXI family TRAP transporter solute-binding subunit [Virgibacillus sp. M23]QRZ18642.1 TAXI family TRAP transporter solute-binding subunit [
MKNKNLMVSIAMLLVLALFLAACGGNEEGKNGDGGSDGGDKPKFLSMLTGGTSGTYYPLGGEMAKIIDDETGIQTDAPSSNASADNVMALSNEEADLAFVQTDVVANAIEGINSFEGKAVDNVQAIGSLYPETIQIVTTKDSGIASVEDLAGKTVSVGAPGSGTYVNAEQILEVHGMTMDDIDAQNLDFGESTGGIQDGNIDAAFITAGTPTGAVEGLSATVDVGIVPIAKDKVQALVEEYPYYAEDTVKAGTYNIEEDVTTVAVLAMLAVRDSLSEEVVYDITKAIYENTDKISHAKGEFITKESALDGIGIDLHPGAKKYFEEEGISASK